MTACLEARLTNERHAEQRAAADARGSVAAVRSRRTLNTRARARAAELGAVRPLRKHGTRRELRNGAALVGMAWLAFMVGTFVWAPIVIWGLDQATAAPRGFVATGTRASLGLIGGILAGLASGYVLDSAWVSR